jgi:hypothetical protein
VAGVLRNLPVGNGGEFRIKTHAGCLVCSQDAGSAAFTSSHNKSS